MDTRIELMDATKICRNFPIAPAQEVLRESFLHTLSHLFEKHSIIFLEGQDEIGKTTLMAQFARQSPDTSISIFITPATQSSYDPDSLRTNILCQAWWILNNKELEPEELEQIDIKTQWEFKLQALQRNARNTRQRYIFVVDGLGEIPDAQSNFRDLILDLLPLGRGDEFRFLICGNPEKFSMNALEKIPFKTFQMSPYTLFEAYQNMADLDFDQDEVAELYRTFKLPGQFATVRRLIQSGRSKNELLADLPSTAPKLLELEWKDIDLQKDPYRDLLALIAFSTLELSTSDLATILAVAEVDVVACLTKISFLTSTDSGRIRFVSDAHQKYAQSKLYQSRNLAESRLIDFLKNSSQDQGAVFLPAVYNQYGKYPELLSFLTPEIFSQILKSTQSLIPLRETAKLGVSAALKLHRDSDLIRLGLQSATIDELYASDIWESEINALIAINDSFAALALAEQATTKEDRLYLLSILANAKEKHDFDIQGLEERIKDAYQQVDHRKLGEKAIDIAANLINIDSMRDLAFDLVEKNAGTDNPGGENALDWAFARLSMKALADWHNSDQSVDAIAKIQDKIKDPKARNFISTGLAYLSFSGERIKAEAEKMERASERLYLLRSWITKNREVTDAADVLEFALRIIITTTEYAPTARDFRELAVALPYVRDHERRRRLIDIVNGQKGTIEPVGPTEDYVRILLIIGLAQKEIEPAACLNMITEAHIYINGIQDLSTKSSCLARLASALTGPNPKGNSKAWRKLHAAAKQELEACVTDLLTKTADQYVVTRGIIRGLAKRLPDLSLELALKLNTEDRRNRAIYDLLRSLLTVSDKDLKIDFISEQIPRITDELLRDAVLVEILSRFAAVEEQQVFRTLSPMKLVSWASEIEDASRRCNACCSILVMISDSQAGDVAEVTKKVVDVLRESWESIDVGWVKIDAGFKIVESLSDMPDLSREFFAKVEAFRDIVVLDSAGSALTFLCCAYLSVRAFSGLFWQKLDTENDLAHVIALIENVPSLVERVGIFTELALRFRVSKRDERFQEIVRTKIKPALERIPKTDGVARDLAIVASAPALYLYHSTSALSLIQSMDFPGRRDEAYREICSFILTKCIRDPYYDPGKTKGKKISRDEIRDLISLVKLIDDDARIFDIITEITESLIIQHNVFSRNEKAEYARELEEICRKKLPSERFISHNGYLLICLARIYRMRAAKPHEWDDLISQAKSINVADRVFILADIASCLDDANKRKRILSEAEALIDEIPSIYDQINRYEILSQEVIDHDRQLSQEYLRDGMRILVRQEEPDIQSAQRRYIDLAYKISPQFAASLASMADDDPARERARDNLRKRLAQLKLKDQISEASSSQQESDFEADDDYASAAWTLLGSLNANRVATIRLEETRRYAEAAASLPMSKAYPIYSWLIQNGIVRYQDTPKATEYLRPVFDATLANCNLIISIARRSTSQVKNARVVAKNEPKPSTVIADMDADEARALLTKWLRANLSDVLYIADGYFGKEDLWVLQVVKGINPECHVYILTSKESNRHAANPADEYEGYWRQNISDQETPPTEVFVLSTSLSNVSPIHDRWWISGKAGVGMGASVNGLGGNRISEIRDFTPAEAEEREAIIRRFVFERVREYKGNRISYLTFTLP